MEWVSRDRGGDLAERMAEARVAPEVRVGLLPEVRDDPAQFGGEERERGHRCQGSNEPSTPPQAEPGAETDYRECRVLATHEGEQDRRETRPRPPGLGKVERDEQKRNGQRG